jgi:hypothetical protein
MSISEDQQEILDLRKIIADHLQWLDDQGWIEGSYYYSNARCELISAMDEHNKNKGTN